MYSFSGIKRQFLTICLLILATFHENVLAERRVKRLVGGTATTIDKSSHLVQLRRPNGKVFCSGNLITTEYVVTAAHCFFELETDPGYVRIIAGVNTRTEVGIERRIVELFVHDDYRPLYKHSDVAVFKMDKRITEHNIVPIKLCEAPLKVGDFIDVFGWGRSKENGLFTNELHTVRLPVAAKEICLNEFEHFMGTNMFCASGLEAKGICQGDSGGGAVHNGQLCGLSSFVWHCGVIGSTSVFTDVYVVRSFIEQALDGEIEPFWYG